MTVILIFTAYVVVGAVLACFTLRIARRPPPCSPAFVFAVIVAAWPYLIIRYLFSR